jgi:hypothetical protein
MTLIADVLSTTEIEIHSEKDYSGGSFLRGPQLSALSAFSGNQRIKEILKTSELVTRADFRVLQFVYASGMPCHYNKYLRAIVPDKAAYEYNQQIWKIFAAVLRLQMGSFSLTSDSNAFLWQNTATSVDELLADESLAANSLSKIMSIATKLNRGIVSFGPGDKHITKTRESIESKIERSMRDGMPSRETAIRFIDDGVRGTIYCKTAKALGRSVVTFIKEAQKERISFSPTDLWKVSYDCAGYADIEMKVKIPVAFEADGSPVKYVLGEIQFHLEDFYDATPDSAIARAHKIYEILRMTPRGSLSKDIPVSYEEMTECSRLYFCGAMLNALKSS